MKFHFLTLFPEMILQGLHTSILGRAAEKNLIEINAVNIRDYTTNKHGKVDDYTYGGGAGMLMQAQPVYDAWKAITESHKIRTVYVTPQGRPFTQKAAKELAKEEELIFLCGHYEGIDERVLEEIVTDYISIGDYVLTGGELPAMVMTDAIARLVPGVLNNDISAETESFHNDLLEYPQYSRPEIWHDKKVPEVLLSGNHTKIAKWRLEQAKERTQRIRPDLYDKYRQKEQVIKHLSKKKRLHIHMIENLRRGKGEIHYANEDNILIYDADSEVYMLTAQKEDSAKSLLDHLPANAKQCVVTQEFLYKTLNERLPAKQVQKCHLACYTKKIALPVKHKHIENLSVKHLDYLLSHSSERESYLLERLQKKELFGAFWEEQLIGFVGIHSEGSIGMLYVDETYRRLGIGASLESYAINLQQDRGETPFCFVVDGNEASMHLQEKLGLYMAESFVWWFF